MKKRYKLLVILAIGIAIGAIGSLVTAEIVKKTSGVEFCGTCHSMQPMAETFKRDVHGGKNVHGFVAECVDCHLPQTSVTRYMFNKALHGINDVFVENFTDVDKIDWIGLRKKREDFVYTDGCLTCHEKIMEKTLEDKPTNAKSLELHALYKKHLGTDKQLECVSCHVTVGHNGELRSELNKRYPEFSFGLE